MTSQAKIIVLELADLFKNLKLRVTLDLSICRVKYDAIYRCYEKAKNVHKQPPY